MLLSPVYLFISWKPYYFNLISLLFHASKMSNLTSSHSSSFYKAPIQPENKKVFYHIIKMNMQEIRRLACEVDENVKKVRENIDTTAILLDKIQTHRKGQH